ncbi:hypothetical protein L7F22_002067 [Adiantum nelumboides]|nr:hypothetical protein [Adiantum nelumboides]
MDVIERRTRGLPTKEFSFEVYNKMENLFGDRQNVDVAGLLYDLLKDDTVPLGDGVENVHVEQPFGASEPHTPPTPVPGAPIPGATSDTTTDAQSEGIKQKRQERTNVTTLKELAESARRMASFMDTTEDRKDTREEARGRRLEKLEGTRQQLQRDNTRLICSSLDNLADSIKSLGIVRDQNHGPLP